MRLEAVLVALLLVTMPLAGCLAGDDGGSGEPVDAQSTDPSTDDAGDAVGTAAGSSDAGQEGMRAFAFDGENIHVPVEESGTFSPPNNIFATGWLGDANEERVDLASSAPKDVPVHVMLTMDYSSTGGSANLYLSGDGATFYTYNYDHDYENDQVRVEAMVGLGGGDGLEAVVAAFAPGEGGNVEWTLNGTVMSHATVLPAKVPVAVSVPPGLAGFHLGGAHGAKASGEAMVWGPDDTYLGTFTGDQGIAVDLGENASSGEYVVLLKSFEAEPGTNAHEHAKHLAGMGLEVHPIGATEDGRALPNLRMLDTEYTFGEWHSVHPGSTVEWSVDRNSPPLAAGIVVRATAPGGAGLGYDVSLESPAGPVVEGSNGFIIITDGAYDYYHMSDPGEENLVAGTYTATVDGGPTTPVEATEIFVDYVR